MLQKYSFRKIKIVLTQEMSLECIYFVPSDATCIIQIVRYNKTLPGTFITFVLLMVFNLQKKIQNLFIQDAL